MSDADNLENVVSDFIRHIQFVDLKEEDQFPTDKIIHDRLLRDLCTPFVEKPTEQNRPCSTLMIKLQQGATQSLAVTTIVMFTSELDQLLRQMNCQERRLETVFPDEHSGGIITLRASRDKIKNLQEIAGAIQMADLEKPSL